MEQCGHDSAHTALSFTSPSMAIRNTQTRLFMHAHKHHSQLLMKIGRDVMNDMLMLAGLAVGSLQMRNSTLDHEGV